MTTQFRPLVRGLFPIALSGLVAVKVLDQVVWGPLTMSKTYGALLALTFTAYLAAGATPAQAQYLDPRAGQALAICNSPAGAAIAECAALRGAIPGAAAPAPGAANVAAAQAAYAACMRAAGVNTVAMQACNAQLNRTLGLPQPNAAAFNGVGAANAIATGAAAYQQCVSAMMVAGQQPGGINPCTPLLNANPAGPGAPAQFAGAGAAGASSLQAQRTAAYQQCVAQLGPSMRGHECTSLVSGGPPPAGINPGGVMGAQPPAPGFAANPPAPGFGPPPGQPADPLAAPPQRPFDPLGL